MVMVTSLVAARCVSECCKLLMSMVPRGGFEPPACPLGGDRSIQLSYRGKNKTNSTIVRYLIHSFYPSRNDKLKARSRRTITGEDVVE